MKLLILIVVFSTSTLAKVPFNANNKVSWEDVKNSVASNLNMQWLSKLAPDGWHMPFISYNSRARWATYLLGEEVIYPEWDDMCLVKNWRYPIASFTGFGQTQPAKCTGENGAWKCTFWSENYEQTKAMVFISLTDNKDYVVETRVWDNGETDWVVFSPNKQISQKQKDTIVKHAESLGLTTAAAFTVDYGKCRNAQSSRCISDGSWKLCKFG